MDLMIATAGGRITEEVRNEIRLSDIRSIEGMAHHDRESLKLRRIGTARGHTA